MALLAHENDRKGLLGTILFHVLLILILLITGFGSVAPLESDNGGVTVNFGEPDAGGGDIQPAASQPESASQPQSSDPNESVITSDDDAPEVVKQEKTPNKTKTKTTETTKPTEEVEKQASIDPGLKARLDKLKRNRENGGSGIGEGEKPGDKGEPDGQEGGDPNGTGKGDLGNGISYNLKGFSVSGKPIINNNSQKTGTVIVDVCVNKQGKIISTKLGRGSTTTDSYLYELSEKAVRELNIKPVGTTTDTNCGTVTIKYERQ
jgi:periplasmic protein TonB